MRSWSGSMEGLPTHEVAGIFRELVHEGKIFNESMRPIRPRTYNYAAGIILVEDDGAVHTWAS